ncbi:hypothetical protein QR680_007614 [Steinernema hermaphroditum]|uniref:Uncharacterized protein n=1 Tax=Steinernema hermaphroditum TaxID=289476 RepID=A0AA39M5M7_9BILA|nr:hypothetical protein QR680_007614 [Steinernema hermaphroditum]
MELREIEFSSNEMDCYNLKMNLSEPDDNYKVNQRKNEVLEYYCTDIDESIRARNRRGVLSMFIGGALKPLQLMYDAFIHYKVLGLTNDVEELQADVSSIDFWTNENLKRLTGQMYDSPKQLSRLSNKLKIKIFDDFLRTTGTTPHLKPVRLSTFMRDMSGFWSTRSTCRVPI